MKNYLRSRNKEFKLIERNNACPICGEKFYFQNQKIPKQRFIKCRNCGVFSIDPVDPNDLDKGLEKAELMTQNIYLHEKKISQHMDYRFRDLAFGEYIEEINKYKVYGNILDIGCGIGSFLLAIKKFGWNEYGIELSSAANLAIELGLNVFQTDFLNTQFDKDFFDVITLFDVIEHISEPIIFLEKIKTILRPGGLLLIITPNLKGISSRLLKHNWLAYTQIDHVILYSPKTLSLLLSKKNFKLKQIKTSEIYITELIFRRNNAPNKEEYRQKEQLRKRELISLLITNKPIKFIRYLINLLFSYFHFGDRIIVYSENEI